MTSSAPPVTESVDDDDEPIDEEQLEEYREMVDNLGNLPVSPSACALPDVVAILGAPDPL